MSLFLEKVILPVLVALLLLMVTNPLNLNWPQRISLGLCIFFGALFLSLTIERSAQGKNETDPKVPSPPAAAPESSKNKGADHVSEKKNEPIDNRGGIFIQGNNSGNPSVTNNTIINPVVRDARGLYQGSTRVGKVQGPVSVDDAKGVIHFQMATFTEYPDPTTPLEYKEYRIQCDQMPREDPNVLVGSLSAAVIGMTCKILK